MFPEHCILKSLVLFALLHIILGIMNNGSFLVQLTGKLIFAYVKSLVTVILLVPHCRLIHQQWGCAYTEFSEDGIITVHLPISAKTLAITTNI